MGTLVGRFDLAAGVIFLVYGIFLVVTGACGENEPIGSPVS